MPASSLFDMVQVSVSGAPGTGPATLGAATPGYQDLTTAGVVSGDTLSYNFRDSNGTVWEIGRGVATFAAGVWTLTRPAPIASSSGGANVSLTSSAIMTLVMLAEDVFPLNVSAVGNTTGSTSSMASDARSLVLSAGPGIAIGMSNSSVVFAADPSPSEFIEPIPFLQTATSQMGLSSMYLAPLNLLAPLSATTCRFFVSVLPPVLSGSGKTTNAGSLTGTTTGSGGVTMTEMLYSLSAGSLFSVASASTAWGVSISNSWSALSSAIQLSFTATFLVPNSLGGTTSFTQSTHTSGPNTNSSTFSTAMLSALGTAVTGLRDVRFPFNTTLPAGYYIMGQSFSTHTAGLNNQLVFQEIMVTQGNAGMLEFGQVTDQGPEGILPAGGLFTTSVGTQVTTSLQISDITPLPAGERMYFQLGAL